MIKIKFSFSLEYSQQSVSGRYPLPSHQPRPSPPLPLWDCRHWSPCFRIVWLPAELRGQTHTGPEKREEKCLVCEMWKGEKQGEKNSSDFAITLVGKRAMCPGLQWLFCCKGNCILKPEPLHYLTEVWRARWWTLEVEIRTGARPNGVMKIVENPEWWRSGRFDALGVRHHEEFEPAEWCWVRLCVL